MLGSDEGMYSAMRVASNNGDVFQNQFTPAAGFDCCFFGSPSIYFVSSDRLERRVAQTDLPARCCAKTRHLCSDRDQVEGGSS